MEHLVRLELDSRSDLNGTRIEGRLRHSETSYTNVGAHRSRIYVRSIEQIKEVAANLQLGSFMRKPGDAEILAPTEVHVCISRSTEGIASDISFPYARSAIQLPACVERTGEGELTGIQTTVDEIRLAAAMSVIPGRNIRQRAIRT